jgi:hypothetical protein
MRIRNAETPCFKRAGLKILKANKKFNFKIKTRTRTKKLNNNWHPFLNMENSKYRKSSFSMKMLSNRKIKMSTRGRTRA